MPDDLSSPNPFWFASEELLIAIFRTEVNALIQLLANYPDVRSLFDVPHATALQRRDCFNLLVHHKLMEIVDDGLAERYADPLPLGEAESKALDRTQALVGLDAPTWVQEIDGVVESLPFHIFNALPEQLRVQGYDANNASQVEAIKSAAETLSSGENIQALIGEVLGQQLQRLERRWAADMVRAPGPSEPEGRRLIEVDGLGRKKIDLSRYMVNLTDKQELAFSLKYEYELEVPEIASRMGIHRKTADEHIKAAFKKVEQARSFGKRKASQAKNTHES